MESKPFNHSIGYMDRFGLFRILPNEHVYVMAIDHLVQSPKRAQIPGDVRLRILSICFVHGSHMGALTPWFYTFREREIDGLL